MSLRTPQADDQKKLRDALPPPEGYCYTLDGRLVPLEDIQQDITELSAQAVFCEVLEITGSLRAACDSLGIVSMNKVKSYMMKDPDFHDAAEAAADRHRQTLYAHAVRRATVGYQVPIIGGKDKNEIVGYETRVSDSLLTLLLKRHFPEFRETKPPQDAPPERPKDLPDFTKMTREERAAMRVLLKQTPEVIDATAVDQDPPKEGDN